MNDSAREIVKRTEKRFDEVFETTGLAKTFNEFEAIVRASRDTAVKKAVQIIDAENIEMVIRRPETARFWVQRVGFQNQFVTGSSRGSLSHDSRNRTEAVRTNTKSLDEYTNLDPELKPKYGTLRLRNELNIESPLSGSGQYGSDVYVLKSKEIEDRTTWTPTDSLGLYEVKGVRRSKFAEAFPRIAALFPWLRRPPERTYVDRFFKPSQYQSLFIPWTRRLLMVPLMTFDLRNNQFTKGRIDPKSKFQLGEQYSSYWEIQIFGKLDLTMVEAFEFSTEPPSGEFLQSLRKHNIKIIDARSESKSEWKEEYE